MFVLASRFLNHCNGAEGIQDFGDLCKRHTSVRQRGEPGHALVSIPTLKQTNNYLSRLGSCKAVVCKFGYLAITKYHQVT